VGGRGVHIVEGELQGIRTNEAQGILEEQSISNQRIGNNINTKREEEKGPAGSLRARGGSGERNGDGPRLQPTGSRWEMETAPACSLRASGGRWRRPPRAAYGLAVGEVCFCSLVHFFYCRLLVLS
jgi:hypothetical protein